MIVGGHSILYSANAEADRAFLRDVLKLPHVDVGHGWLIFGLPPAEIAVHPSDGDDHHEFYFMVDDVKAFVAEMETHHIACAPVSDQGWGLLTSVSLPSGGRLGVYQARHARPNQVAPANRKAANRRAAKKTARKRQAAKKPIPKKKPRRRGR
jgi:hypothetical protein